MKLYLTEGMFGKKIEQIGEDSENAKKMLEYVFCWKTDARNQKRFKVEPYDRLIFGDDEIAIDFGDYCTFMLITDVSENEKNVFQNS